MPTDSVCGRNISHIPETIEEDGTNSFKNSDLTTAKESKKTIDPDITEEHNKINTRKGDYANDRKKPEKPQKNLSDDSNTVGDTKKDESKMQADTVGRIEVPVEADSPRPARHTRSANQDVSASGESAALQEQVDHLKLDNRPDNTGKGAASAVQVDEDKNRRQASITQSSAVQESEERISRPSSASSHSSASSSSSSSSISSSSSSTSSSRSRKHSNSVKEENPTDNQKDVKGSPKPEELNDDVVLRLQTTSKDNQPSVVNNGDFNEDAHAGTSTAADNDDDPEYLHSATSIVTQETKDQTEFKDVEEETKHNVDETPEEEFTEDPFAAMMTSFIEVEREEIESDEEAQKQNLVDSGDIEETSSVLATAEDQKMDQTLRESTTMKDGGMEQEKEAESDDTATKHVQDTGKEMLKDREHSQIKTEEIDLIDEQKEKMLPGQNIQNQRRGSDVSSASSASVRSSSSSSSTSSSSSSDATSITKQKPDSRSTSSVASDHTAEASKNAVIISETDLIAVVMEDAAAAATPAYDNIRTPEALDEHNLETVFHSNSPKDDDIPQTMFYSESPKVEDNPEAVFHSKSPEVEDNPEAVFHSKSPEEEDNPELGFHSDSPTNVTNHHLTTAIVGSEPTPEEVESDPEATTVDRHLTNDGTENITVIDSDLQESDVDYVSTPADKMESFEIQPDREALEDPIIQRLTETAAVLSTVQMTKGNKGHDSDSVADWESTSQTKSNTTDLAPKEVPQALEGHITPLLERSESVVEIKNMQIDKIQLDEAVALLQSKEGIQALHMVNCGMDDEDVRKVLEALQKSPSNPVVVNLSHNHVTSASVKNILALLKEKPSVEAIILRSTRLGDEGIIELVDGITSLFPEKKHDSIESGQPYKLHELDLSNCDFGTKGAEALAKMIKSNAAIDALNLSNNKLVESDGWVVIGQSLAENSTLDILGLDHNSIGNEGMEYIADSLQNNMSVTTLDLSFVGIKEKGGESLMNMLKKNTRLIEINLTGNNMSQQLQNDIQKYISLNRAMH